MADFPANNDRCGDHHQVLDNILPFQREHERKCPKYLPGEEDDGQKGARHMQEEQHQGHAEQWLVDKAEANGHLPDAKDVDESGDREPGHGLDHECSRWAHPQELERSEPKEHDSHADAQEEQPVFFIHAPRRSSISLRISIGHSSRCPISRNFMACSPM
jgi:hypothetical protein